jgi:molybdate transport system regulatory protein
MSSNLSSLNFFSPWHLKLGEGEISPKRLKLLQAIDATGSISQAAKEVGMTYKAAWDAVDLMNNLAGEPIVARQQGGKGGGGAQLTAKGLEIVAMHERLVALQAKWQADLADVQTDLFPLYRRLKMQTSARNTFYGQIQSIKTGAVNAEVILSLQGGDQLVATVTRESVEQMHLAPGKSAWALVKASWVLLAEPGVGEKTSARNCLCGKVSRITQGSVNVEVVLELPGGTHLAAIITHESEDTLAIQEGQPLCALFKAGHVLLGVDE